MPVIAPAPEVNNAVAFANSLPDLIGKLDDIQPGLAAQLESKPLLASRSPWGTLAVTAVAWAVAKYGLGWDEATQQIVAGVAILVGSYAMRLITKQPIAGIVSTPAIAITDEPIAPVVMDPNSYAARAARFTS